MKDDPKHARARKRCSTSTASPTTSPFIRSFKDNGYVYVGWNGPSSGAVGGEEDTRHALHDGAQAALPPRSRSRRSSSSNGPPTATTAAPSRFGHDGMLYVTSGDGTSDSDTNIVGQDMTQAAGQGAAHRRRSSRPGQGLLRAEGQSVRRHEGRPAGDVGLRPAQSVADDASMRRPATLGRQQRPGPVGAGVPGPARATTTAGA